jgi:hypothetical protein
MQIMKKAERLVKRRQTVLDNSQITDQSYKKSCDINNIVKSFMKNGNLPTTNKIAHYGDFSEVPTLEEAFNISQNAAEAFYALPAALRKELDNDASKLELWLSDEKNHEAAIKHGLMEKTEKPLDLRSHAELAADLMAAKLSENASNTEG